MADEGPEMSKPGADFVEDSLKWRGVVLTGRYAHWCCEWDDLPIAEEGR